jgi:hypothetical protein
MSTLKADTIQSTSGGAATLTSQAAAKVFSAFDMGSSFTLQKSLNVSSLGDNGTGSGLINLTNSFSDTHPSIVSGVGDNLTHNAAAQTNEVQSTSQYKHNHFENNGGVDVTDCSNAAFGDLA